MFEEEHFILNRETNKETQTQNNMSHPTLYGVLDAEKKQNQLHQAALLAQVKTLSPKMFKIGPKSTKRGLKVR